MANPPRRTVATSPSRGRTALFAAIAALIVVCGLAFVLQGDAEVAMVSGAGDATEERAAEAADAGIRVDESQRAKAVDATDDSASAKVAADGALTPEKRTRNHVRIRVIDGKTKEPVEGAEVIADPVEDALERTQWTEALWLSSRSEASRKFGQKQLTDADGCAWLRLPNSAQVVASKGSLVAFAETELSELKPEGVELALLPSRTASVVVMGSDGKPKSGVPIGLSARFARGEMSDDTDEWALGRTDAEGRAQAELAAFLPPGAPPKKLEFFVRAPGLVMARVDAATNGEATLRLPAHGSMRVRAIGLDGKPLPDAPTWGVTAYTEPQDDGSPTTSMPGSAGEAWIPYVGLGQTVNLSFQASGYYMHAYVPGPTAANQEVAHEFSLLAQSAISIRARLLDADGAPLVNYTTSFWKETGGTWEASRTDSDGRVWFRMRGDDDELKPITGRFRAQLRGESFYVFDPVTVAPGRDHDCGDLRAKAVDVVATGRFVCDEPLGPGISGYVATHNGRRWGHSGDHIVQMMDDEDSFVILDAVGGRNPRMQLTVSAPGFLNAEPIEFVRGAELTVRLQRGPRFEARVLVDAGVSWLVERTGLDFVVKNENDQGRYIRGKLVDGQWVFASTELKPGVYSISIESGSASDDLAQMDSVRIGVGEPMDPRLQPWDLRSTIRVMTIRTRGADNKLLEGWHSVYRRSIRDGSWESCASLENGIAQFLTTATALDLALDLEDRGFVRRSGVIGDLDLVVPEPQSVVVHVEGMPRMRNNAPMAIQASVPEDWGTQHGLPDWANPVIESEWDRDTRKLTVRLAQPCAFHVDFQRRQNDDWASIALVPCVVAAGQKELRIQAPPEVVTAAQAFLDPEPVPAPSNGGR